MHPSRSPCSERRVTNAAPGSAQHRIAGRTNARRQSSGQPSAPGRRSVLGRQRGLDRVPRQGREPIRAAAAIRPRSGLGSADRDGRAPVQDRHRRRDLVPSTPADSVAGGDGERRVADDSARDRRRCLPSCGDRAGAPPSLGGRCRGSSPRSGIATARIGRRQRLAGRGPGWWRSCGRRRRAPTRSPDSATGRWRPRSACAAAAAQPGDQQPELLAPATSPRSAGRATSPGRALAAGRAPAPPGCAQGRARRRRRATASTVARRSSASSQSSGDVTQGGSPGGSGAQPDPVQGHVVGRPEQRPPDRTELGIERRVGVARGGPREDRSRRAGPR